MTQHINQVISVVIRGAVGLEIIEEDKRIEGISKDLGEEPNEARVTIYNLNTDTRAAIKAAADQYTPIEIKVSPLGSAEPVTAFIGEIEKVENKDMRPGYETRIRALSQKRAHRAAYVSQKTYAAGTPKSDIVADMITAIGIPSDIDKISDKGILLAHSFSGPAFPLLCRFVFDMGMFCFISDGVLRISNVYDPPNPTVIRIAPEMMISEPQENTRTSPRDTALHTVTEMTAIDPSRKKSRRQKRSVVHEEIGENDYVEIEVVDTVVPGIELECFAIPNLSPDHLITFDDETFYRAYKTELYGDDFGDTPPTTRILADRFEGDPPGGGLL